MAPEEGLGIDAIDGAQGQEVQQAFAVQRRSVVQAEAEGLG